jgi:hypothetical protein
MPNSNEFVIRCWIEQIFEPNKPITYPVDPVRRIDVFPRRPSYS